MGAAICCEGVWGKSGIDIDDFYASIGRRIRQERTNLGFSQADLACAMGMSRASIVNIEAGRQHLPLHTLYKIAYQLSVPPSSLLPDRDITE